MISYKNDIWKAGEVLRKSLVSFTGHDFIYSDQETLQDYPIGVINKISESSKGLGFKEYSLAGLETTYRYYTVVFQVSFIAAKSRADQTAESIFLPSSVLNAIITGWSSSDFQSFIKINSMESGASCSVLDISGLRTALDFEAEQTQVPANIDITMYVRSGSTREDAVKCIGEDELPLNIEVTID